MANHKERYKNIVGQKFGRLMAIKKVGIDKSRTILWQCKYKK